MASILAASLSPPKVITILTAIISLTCSSTSSRWNHIEGIVSGFFSSHCAWESHLCYYVPVGCSFSLLCDIPLCIRHPADRQLRWLPEYIMWEDILFTPVHEGPNEQRQGCKWKVCLFSQRNVYKAWGCAPNHDYDIHLLLKITSTGSNKGNLGRG